MVDLDEIEKRVAEASPGPWRLDDGTGWGIATAGNYPERRVIIVNDSYDDPGQDATFIAHSREDVPALVAELRELRERVRFLRFVLSGALGVPAEYAEDFSDDRLSREVAEMVCALQRETLDHEAE